MMMTRYGRLILTVHAFLGLLLVLAASASHAQGSRPAEDPAKAGAQRLHELGLPGPPPDGVSPCAHYKQAWFEKFFAEHTDPTDGQNAYDALYYGLDLDLYPEEGRFAGAVTVRLRAVEQLGWIDLNLADELDVAAVTQADSSLVFSRSSDMLRVELGRVLEPWDETEFTVHYEGWPGAGSALHYTTVGGQTHIWTLSEPYGARTWWPCKDFPEDKADSVDIIVSVPDPLIAASNGNLLNQQSDGGRTTFHWRESYPITTYLVSLAIYPYEVYSDWYEPASGGKPMELLFYNFPHSREAWEPAQAMVKEMIKALAEAYGEYPFIEEKYGHAQFAWGGGMEHQTLSSMGGSDEWLIVHELAHQWWGDLVTCKTFRDIWLNEGFAVFSEALWAESRSGIEAYHERLRGFTHFGPGTVYIHPDDPAGLNWGRIFDQDLSYHKGAWILHMLRHILGDETFFAILRQYREEYRFSSASTEDFRLLAERVCGRDLAAFFDQWVYGEGYPIYAYDWTAAADGSGWKIPLTVRQVQNGARFDMPLDVAVTTASGTEIFVMETSGDVSRDTLIIGEEPLVVDLDPDQWVLRRVIPPMTKPTFENPILLVNGTGWTHPIEEELRAAYENRAFVGQYGFDFWDAQSPPAGGYPWTLPTPRGTGSVPAEIMAEYETVIWIGSSDPSPWFESPGFSYLESGGNVILLAASQGFLLDPHLNYLGIEWNDEEAPVDYAQSELAGLPDLPTLGEQYSLPVFDLQGNPETTLLYAPSGSQGQGKGLGFIRQPAGGGTHNPEGGRFAFICGRPYRWEHASLRASIETLLREFMPQTPDSRTELRLQAPAPNPISDRGTIRFYLPSPGKARLEIFDVSGRRLRALRDGVSPAGWNAEPWNGRNQDGDPVASGVYFARLEAGSKEATRRLLVVR